VRTEPEQAAPQDHRRSQQLGDPKSIAAEQITTEKGQQGAGKAAEEEPGSQNFSIAMRAMEKPQQKDKEHELDEARIDLDWVEWNSERRSGHNGCRAEDDCPRQLSRSSVITSSFQATDCRNRTPQREPGRKNICCPPDWEPEVRGVGNGGQSSRGQPQGESVSGPEQQIQQDSPYQRSDDGQQSYVPDFVCIK